MNEKNLEEIYQRPMVNLLRQTDDIVISGLAGRFPMSNNVDEFANNLFNNIDMITDDVDGERWPKCK